MYEQDLLNFLLNENNFYNINDSEIIFYINNTEDLKKIKYLELYKNDG